MPGQRTGTSSTPPSAPRRSGAEAQAFYDREYARDVYAAFVKPIEHPQFAELSAFVRDFGLKDKKCLEIGCGRGALQDLVDDYTGCDLSESVAPFLQKTFVQCSATELPFADNSFDAAWSVAVLEHVPNPEQALHEMRRVLKPGGLLYLSPAWQCRSWAANGSPVRPYSDFGLGGKLVKASIPIRDSVLWRSMFIFPKRLARLLSCTLARRPTQFHFIELKPNYDTFWMSDSDAVNSMDPFEAIQWFVSRGDECVNYPTIARQFLVRTGAIIVRIRT